MGVFLLVFLGTLIVLGTLALLHRRSHRQTLSQRARLTQRRREQLTDTPERIALAKPSDSSPVPAPLGGSGAPLSTDPLVSTITGTLSISPVGQRFELADPGAGASIRLIAPPTLAGSQLGVPEGGGGGGGGPFPGARFVKTPDGEAMMTAPPFKAKPALFNRRQATYARALLGRLPPWVVLCPKTRMDALVSPTPPDGRDPQDWRTWRTRVRWRAVDLLLCDRRTWRPVLAVIFDHPHASADASPSSSPSRRVGGGRDRIIDEVLHAVGIPFVRATGDFLADWAAIEPYVSEAILRSGLVDEAFDKELAELEEMRRLGDSAVNLMAIDGDDGFALQ